MSAVVLLDQAIAFVRAGFTKKEVVTVQKYAGEFSTAEMKHLSYTCPAILLTVLGWKETPAGARITGRHARQVRLAAFVVTKNAKDRQSRMDEAMALSEALSVLLRQWSPMTQEPSASALKALDITVGGLDTEASCENLYNRAVDEMGQALWLVDWYQSVRGAIPIGPSRPAVPYEQMPAMTRVDIEDNTHVNQVPAAAQVPDAPITVTEKIDFANN